MTVVQAAPAPVPTRLLTELEEADFKQFQKISSQATDPSLFPLSEDIVDNVVIYSAPSAIPLLRGDASKRQAMMDEWQKALYTGPGVFVVKDLIPCDVIDRAEAVAKKVDRKDRPPSKNSRRVFAFTEKHAKEDPASFAEYYGNDVLSAVCESWLGPSYQITGTTNATFKGGNQQDIHRDYRESKTIIIAEVLDVSHQALERIRRIPVVNQIASQFLTLQSAIAHTDMPKSTGPTRFMPFSQTFDKGYIAVRDPTYIEYVKPRMVQLELKKGDAVFFNPAIFHQPGVNETDNERIANLLQVSSPFGRSMESCDRLGMTKSVWPVIKQWHQDIQAEKSDKLQSELDAVIAATCSDYGYPKVIDLVQPGPESQADVIREALAQGKEDDAVYAHLDSHQEWHRP